MSLAADSKGRFWAVWTDGSFGDEQILAARSNDAARSAAAGRRRRVKDANGVTRSTPARPTRRSTCSWGSASATTVRRLDLRDADQPGLTLTAKKRRALGDASPSPTPVTGEGRESQVRGQVRQDRLQGPRRRSTPQGQGDRSATPRLRGCDPEAEVSYSVLPAGELSWSPSDQWRAEHRSRQAARRDGLGSRFWRCGRVRRRRGTGTGDAGALRGARGRGPDPGRRRPSTCRGSPRVLVGPGQRPAAFNDTDEDALWLVFGAPPEAANTLEMTPETLASLYPDGPKALPPELAT